MTTRPILEAGSTSLTDSRIARARPRRWRLGRIRPRCLRGRPADLAEWSRTAVRGPPGRSLVSTRMWFTVSSVEVVGGAVSPPPPSGAPRGTRRPALISVPFSRELDEALPRRVDVPRSDQRCRLVEPPNAASAESCGPDPSWTAPASVPPRWRPQPNSPPVPGPASTSSTIRTSPTAIPASPSPEGLVDGLVRSAACRLSSGLVCGPPPLGVERRCGVDVLEDAGDWSARCDPPAVSVPPRRSGLQYRSTRPSPSGRRGTPRRCRRAIRGLL